MELVPVRRVLDVEVFDVRIVQIDGSTRRVVEPLDEGDDRALAAARSTNKRSCFSCSEEKAYPFDDLYIWAGRVVEFDVLEFNLAQNLFKCKAGRARGSR